MNVSSKQHGIEGYELVRRMADLLALSVPLSVERQDLIDAGMGGLMEAVRRNDARNDKSRAAIKTHIRGAMLARVREKAAGACAVITEYQD